MTSTKDDSVQTTITNILKKKKRDIKLRREERHQE